VIDVVRGDITAIPADAIVNAAQSSLLGGGGVDGAIHAAAGPNLLAECHEVRRRDLPDGLPPGEAVVTGAGDLPARFVIHTVGPKFWEYPDGGVHVLARSYASSMAAAHAVGATSITFPAISCGVYRWDPVNAAPIAMRAVRESLPQAPGVRAVTFVLFNDEAFDAFRQALDGG